MTRLASSVSCDHDELDRRERKRLQNRMAQRAYRRNQKQRVQALEAAVANAAAPLSLSFSQITPPLEENEGVDPPDHGPENPYGDHPRWDFPDQFPEPAVSRTALHRAICDGKDSMARLLVEHGADVMKTDSSGRTALHLAAECGSEATMRLLLSKAADPNVTDYLGRTPLFAAVQGDNEAAATVLLEASSSPTVVDINWKDGLGTNPLHLAVECGFESMVRLLLAHGADINA